MVDFVEDRDLERYYQNASSEMCRIEPCYGIKLCDLSLNFVMWLSKSRKEDVAANGKAELERRTYFAKKEAFYHGATFKGLPNVDKYNSKKEDHRIIESLTPHNITVIPLWKLAKAIGSTYRPEIQPMIMTEFSRRGDHGAVKALSELANKKTFVTNTGIPLFDQSGKLEKKKKKDFTSKRIIKKPKITERNTTQSAARESLVKWRALGLKVAQEKRIPFDIVHKMYRNADMKPSSHKAVFERISQMRAMTPNTKK